jgi:hypothetical protein
MRKSLSAHGLNTAFACTLLALPAASAFAGAWVAEEGRTLSILKFSHTNDAAVFDDSRDRTRFPEGGTSRQDQLNLYIEHGLTPDLTLIGNFYYNYVGSSSSSSWRSSSSLTLMSMLCRAPYHTSSHLKPKVARKPSVTSKLSVISAGTG